MKLTNATEKALAVVAMLATQSGNQPIPSSVIVKQLEISDSYTKKLLRKLVVADVITSSPGNGGGFRLKRKLKDISLLEIVEAIEGPINTYNCQKTLDNAFANFPNKKVTEEPVVKKAFSQADSLWRHSLTKKSVGGLIEEAFGKRAVSVNWIELA